MKPLFQHRSIAFRLIAAVLAVELASSILAIFLSLGFERHSHFRSFDVMLHGRVDSILGAVQDAEDTQDSVMLNQADLHVPPGDIYEVYDNKDGRLLGRSPNWQGYPGGLAAAPQKHFSQLMVNGLQYRVLCFQGSRIVDPAEPGGGKRHQVTVLYGAPTFHVWRAIHGAVQFYAAGSLLLLLVTGPLIAWLLHRGLFPLRQLAALAATVSVDSWQFSPPASARQTPELAPLTLAIENVLQRLERSFLQQQAFVGDAAHELKTAVAVIKSSLQLLDMKPHTAAEYKTGLERCLTDCLRLEEIVAKMLTLARVENAAPAAGSQPAADLTECLRNTIVQLETVAALRNVRIEITAPESSACMVPVAAEDCSLLITNLLLNALQHSPDVTAVEVRLTPEAEAVQLQIEDHGEGIAAEALPHIFDRFYRGDPSRARSTGGTGLGLAICKAIVEKADGSIILTSQPGQGTIATVRMPLTKENTPTK